MKGHHADTKETAPELPVRKRNAHKQDEPSIVTGNPSEKSRWYRAYSSTLGNRGAHVVLNKGFPKLKKGENL